VIGVGYNATPESQRALTTARQLADAHGATVEALWFISPEDVRRRAPLPADWPDAGAILLTETQERLDQIPGAVRARRGRRPA
jgi:nucleotide-binding universal stress UspA family protein